MSSNLGKVSVYPSQELEYERIPEPNLGSFEGAACKCKPRASGPHTEAEYRERVAASRRSGFLLLISGLALYTLLAVLS